MFGDCVTVLSHSVSKRISNNCYTHYYCSPTCWTSCSRFKKKWDFW